ncbi:MAG: efflux RND transporter permease subunit [Burkholderiales bacterium]|nr:efflux RND transporter permease subunit [Burkholderiales bacterium]
MLSAIVRAAIRSRGIVLALACVLLAYGAHTLGSARTDVFPEFAPPLAIVQAAAPGLSAEQVEVLVTQPIENALGGLQGIATLRSKSLPGLAMVTLTFDPAMTVQAARQQVSDRLGTVVGQLPAGTGPATLLPLTSSTSVVMVAALTSAQRSPADLHDLAQWTLRPQLQGLPGVADVVVFGGESRQLQVQLDAAKLAAADLTAADVVAAARRSTGLEGAGFIEGANQRLAIRTEGQARTPQDVAQTPVTVRNGIPLRIGDVASVAWAPGPPVGAASLDARPAVLLVIESQYGADPLAVTATLDRAFSSLAPLLDSEQVQLDTSVFRPARFIVTALAHLRTALLAGGALVVVVLFLFLMNLRTAAISACAIPLSLVAAAVVLQWLGVSLNTMTLGGLAIALGEVVDDAIIDVENIFRRLRENRARPDPLPAATVVWQASLEVRGSVVYATFIVVLAFLPVLLLPGVAGQLFAPLAKAYMLAVLASLAVALTVTPALSALLLPQAGGHAAEPRFVQALKTGYGRWLGALERHTGATIAAVALLCAAALACLPFFGGSFIPDLKEGHFLVHTALAPGTSLAETMRIGDRVSLALRAIPGVRLVAQRAGRAQEVVDPVDVNVSEFEVDLQPMGGRAQARTLDRIRQALGRFPGMTTSVNTFLAERIDETISGTTAPMAIEVHGKDLDLIDAKAREVMRVLQQVPGAVGVRMQAPPGTPQLVVRLRPPLLEAAGLRAADVLDTVQTAFQGTQVAQVVDGNRVRDVVVRLRPQDRRTPAQLAQLRLPTLFGHAVTLGSVADIRETAGRSQIAHSMGQRVQTVTSGVRGRSIAEFSADVRRKIRAQVPLPRGMYFVFGGEARERSQAQGQLLADALLSLAGIVLLLSLALRRRRALLLVLANLPFALVGGVVAVLLTGATLSLGSLVGFVTLFGITLRNAIMLVSHYEHLVRVEGLRWGPEAALRGARERLVPILMTASVTALALLPLALRSSQPGNEVEGPMAIVILGGLVTSTLLNLLVLPALSLRFGDFGARSPGDPLASDRPEPGAQRA